MSIIATFLPVIALFAGPAFGQTTTTNATLETNTPPLSLENKAEKSWSFSASSSMYFVPDDRDYVQPTITADHGWLHLEARYNYENLETGSTWVGYNLSGGEKLEWEFTPMLGGVFGDTTGIAPGYKGSLNWRKFELYSEGEFVIDTGDTSRRFFYTWSQVTFAPVDWFRFGFVTQRTRAYQSDLDIQRGLLLGLTYKRLDFTTSLFNLDESRPTVVLGVTVSF